VNTAMNLRVYKGREFLDQLSDYWFLRKGYTSWRWFVNRRSHNRSVSNFILYYIEKNVKNTVSEAQRSFRNMRNKQMDDVRLPEAWEPQNAEITSMG
jgi:hypothetical protein